MDYSLHQKRRAHPRGGGAHEAHDGNLVFGGVNREADGVESDQNRNRRERQRNAQTQGARGFQNSGELFYHHLILAVVYLVHDIFKTFRLQKARDGLVLAGVFGFHVQGSAQRVLAELFQGLGNERVFGMALLESGEGLAAGNVFHRFHFLQFSQRRL